MSMAPAVNVPADRSGDRGLTAKLIRRVQQIEKRFLRTRHPAMWAVIEVRFTVKTSPA